jgi:hypothetical protein
VTLAEANDLAVADRRHLLGDQDLDRARLAEGRCDRAQARDVSVMVGA